MAGFSTVECAWSQTSMKLFNKTIIGLRGFEFSKRIEKELIYAAGSDPIDITEGNRSASGNILLLKSTFDELNEAAITAGFDDIIEVPYPSIIISCAFQLNDATPIRLIETPLGAAFTDYTVAMQQNAKMAEVPLPFISRKILLRKR